MGGYNSGRRGGKTCTNELRLLDVRRLARDGLLKPGPAFMWSWRRGGKEVASIQIWPVDTDRVRLIYRQRRSGGEWQDLDYSVRLARTACHYGGDRAWWLCPCCGRRAALLYLGSSGPSACRYCHRLAYQCQREAPDDRSTRRADKLRERLGWEAGILHGEGGKPKGMHWKTFERLTATHNAHVTRAVAGMAAKLGLTLGRLDSINEGLDRLGL
ncbi:MAG: hypothetical protein EPN61_17705 [Burkholderiaceae bacterium]|nr:MAG: hypothetical protein EPN61_17705 [Burkholderiaceae bacterium]